MAVVNTKSTPITNADTNPPTTMNAAGVVKGATIKAVGTLETAAADSQFSCYRFVRVPSNAVISSIIKRSDDLDSGTSGRFAIGVRQTAQNGGAQIGTISSSVSTGDALFQAAAAQQADTGTEIRFSALDINGCEKPLWELISALGGVTMTDDPRREYDICATLTVATGLQAGTFSLEVTYAV